MKKLVTILFVLMLAVGVGAEETFEREVPAQEGGLIEFDLDAGGSINMTGWDKDSVWVLATVSGRDDDIIQVTVDERDGRVLVKSKFTERRRQKETYIDIEVRVPSVFNLKVKSMGGGLHVDGVEGTFSGTTMGGRIQLNNIKGELDLQTMGGRIELTNSDVDGKVTTMGGEALVEDVFGDVKVTSMGGEVTRRRVTRTNGDSIGEEVHIDTMGGDIDVSDAPRGAEVHTMGGDITIDSVREYVKAETMGGDIEISEVDGWVKATTMAGDVKVRVIGNHDVELQSMHGEVRLVIPEGDDLDIDVELAYTKNSKRNYSIISDFPINIQETDDWEYDHGSPRKTIHGTSSGGGNRIVIRTVNGNVYLTR